jgi:hypothetical protein
VASVLNIGNGEELPSTPVGSFINMLAVLGLEIKEALDGAPRCLFTTWPLKHPFPLHSGGTCGCLRFETRLLNDFLISPVGEDEDVFW